MAKLLVYKGGQTVVYFFFCPGCKREHGFTVPPWTFNGDMERPTFSPSLMCDRGNPTRQCHTFVRDGKIQFLSDCHHELKGTTVELADVGEQCTRCERRMQPSDGKGICDECRSRETKP